MQSYFMQSSSFAICPMVMPIEFEYEVCSKWTCNIIDKNEESIMNRICLFRKSIFVCFSRVHPTAVFFSLFSSYLA